MYGRRTWPPSPHVFFIASRAKRGNTCPQKATKVNRMSKTGRWFPPCSCFNLAKQYSAAMLNLDTHNYLPVDPLISTSLSARKRGGGDSCAQPKTIKPDHLIRIAHKQHIFLIVHLRCLLISSRARTKRGHTETHLRTWYIPHKQTYNHALILSTPQSTKQSNQHSV